MAGWRTGAIELDLTPEDLDLLDAVLCVVPELRVVTRLAQLARQAGLAYPVRSTDELTAVLRGDRLTLGGHGLDAESIARVMPDEWFPIAHEGELLSMVHLALVRCRWEAGPAALDEARAGPRA